MSLFGRYTCSNFGLPRELHLPIQHLYLPTPANTQAIYRYKSPSLVGTALSIATMSFENFCCRIARPCTYHQVLAALDHWCFGGVEVGTVRHNKHFSFNNSGLVLLFIHGSGQLPRDF